MFESIFNKSVLTLDKFKIRDEFVLFLKEIQDQKQDLRDLGIGELYEKFKKGENHAVETKNKLLLLFLIDCNISLPNSKIDLNQDLMSTNVIGDWGLEIGDWGFDPKRKEDNINNYNPYISLYTKFNKPSMQDLGRDAFKYNFTKYEMYDWNTQNPINIHSGAGKYLMHDTMTHSLVLIDNSKKFFEFPSVGWNNKDTNLTPLSTLYTDRLLFLETIGQIEKYNSQTKKIYDEAIGGIEVLLLYKSAPHKLTVRTITKMKIKAFQSAFNTIMDDEEFKQKALFVVFGDLKTKTLDSLTKFLSKYKPWTPANVSKNNIANYLFAKISYPHMSLSRANTLNTSLLIPYSPTIDYSLNLFLRPYENIVFETKKGLKFLLGNNAAEYFYYLLLSEDTNVSNNRIVLGTEMKKLLGEGPFDGILNIRYLCPFFHTAIRIFGVYKTTIENNLTALLSDKKFKAQYDLLKSRGTSNLIHFTHLNPYLITCLEMDSCSVEAKRYIITK